MTEEEFNKFSEEQKKVAIFEARKITERVDQRVKYELFQIDGIFVETKTSLQHQFKRVIQTYRAEEVPAVYAELI